MAISSGQLTYFAGKYGIAVILYDHSFASSATYGETNFYAARTFLGWSTKRSFQVDLAAGTYSIEMWLIGGTTSGIEDVTYQGGGALISVLQAKR